MRRNANIVGQTIARIRNERGWTQDYLVDRLQLFGCGMTRAVLANVETGRSVVSELQLLAIAAVIGVNPAELFPANWKRKLQQILAAAPPVIHQRRRKHPRRKPRQ